MTLNTYTAWINETDQRATTLLIVRRHTGDSRLTVEVQSPNVVRGGRATKDQICFASAQTQVLLAQDQQSHVECEFRMTLAHLIEDRDSMHHRRLRADRADHDPTRQAAGVLSGQTLKPAHRLYHHASVRQDGRPGGGDGGRTACTGDQLDTEVTFQRAQLTAQCRLTHVQPRGRLAEM
ncbi:hypothetical protein H4W33_002803 [Kibdelosporangium phytohabitans]|uniref:Uncharacterized protein n=1 Tax=Kibdelosporangium phytohabitans TaxID=860235 RepID=A0A0N7F4S5_9PSEU|nr:hypothetical protein AOZ06_40120 [Kibdelosporangium phytohabitans]MBE1463791.1 hypothetical protein [Kibdelosporangium phytohabitans]